MKIPQWLTELIDSATPLNEDQNIVVITYQGERIPVATKTLMAIRLLYQKDSEKENKVIR